MKPINANLWMLVGDKAFDFAVLVGMFIFTLLYLSVFFLCLLLHIVYDLVLVRGGNALRRRFDS